MYRATLTLVALSACTGEAPPTEYTEDVRIDGGPEDADAIDSSGTEMCVAPNGVVYVLWMDDRNDPGGRRDIWMNRSVNRGGDPEPSPDGWFPSPVRVNQGEGQVWNPDMYCNELGVFVVWEDDRDGVLENHQIYFNRSSDQGETFDPEDTLLEGDLDPEGNSMSLEPKITGRGQDLFVTWYDSLNGAYDIFMSSNGDGGAQDGWRAPIRVDSDDPAGAAYSAHPEIAISESASDVWITWEDSRDGAPDVYFARSGNGGVTFEEDQRLDGGDDEGASDSFTPQICTDQLDQVYVFWHDSRGGEFSDIYSNFSANKGDDWSAAALRLDTDAAGFANSLFPRCVMNGGDAHVAWQDRRGQNYDAYYRVLTYGIPGDEMRADMGSPEGQSNSVEVQIATDLDVVAIAWQDDRWAAESSGYDDLYYNYTQAGGPFKTYENDEDDLRMDSMYDGQSYKIDTQFAILGGEWYAAWTDGRGGSSDVYFQRRAIGEATVPPTAAEPKE